MGASGESDTGAESLPPSDGKATEPILTPALIQGGDSAALIELDALLKQHDLWLGYSPVKGWVLLDRHRPEYKDWKMPFVLLRDGSIDRLSREEFSNGPHGPWALNSWNCLDKATKQRAGSASDLLPEVQRYLDQEAERSAQLRAKREIERSKEIPSADPHRVAFKLPYELAPAIAEPYAAADLSARINCLTDWAKRIQGGAAGQEPMWSQGTAAADRLEKNGIDHLWHFTDARNLERIRGVGGLISWAGLSALGITDAHLVANELSRSCDARLGRERHVRLSFIPNSWFFQRVHKQGCLVWLRFSKKALAIGDVSYSLGNAASGNVALKGDLPSMALDWKMVVAFAGPHSEAKGPTKYPCLY